MEQTFRLQPLHQEAAPFPYSWREYISNGPCRFSMHPSLGSGDIPLSPEDLMRVSELFHLDSGRSCSGGKLEPLLSDLEYHIHNHCQVTLCLEGEFRYVIGKTCVVLKPGDILLINEMIPHTWIIPTEHAVRQQFGFYPHALNANAYSQSYIPYILNIYSQHYPYILCAPSSPNYVAIRALLKQISIVHETRPFCFDGMIHNYIFDISCLLINALGLAVGQPAHMSDVMQKAIQYIDENLAGDLSIAGLADHVNMNPSYFSTYFKKQLGIACKRYILEKRIAKAANLLRSSDFSITQILFECGFASSSAFYSAFNEVYAISPAMFRRMQPVKMRKAE